MRNYKLRTINHSFFQTWSPEMAWALGLWLTDGTLRKGDNLISIGFADLELLTKLQTVMQSDHTPYHDKRYNGYYLIQITSTLLKNTLIELGVTEAKSLTVSCPTIPSEFWWDFVRGVFEGNGHCCIRQRSPNHQALQVVFTSGSELFVKQFQKINIERGLYGGSIQNSRNSFRLVYSTTPAKNIFKLMYTGTSEHLLLTRKKEKFYNYHKLAD